MLTIGSYFLSHSVNVLSSSKNDDKGGILLKSVTTFEMGTNPFDSDSESFNTDAIERVRATLAELDKPLGDSQEEESDLQEDSSGYDDTSLEALREETLARLQRQFKTHVERTVDLLMENTLIEYLFLSCSPKSLKNLIYKAMMMFEENELYRDGKMEAPVLIYWFLQQLDNTAANFDILDRFITMSLKGVSTVDQTDLFVTLNAINQIPWYEHRPSCVKQLQKLMKKQWKVDQESMVGVKHEVERIIALCYKKETRSTAYRRAH